MTEKPNTIPEVNPKPTGKKNDRSDESRTTSFLDLEHNAPNRCSLTGMTEEECRILFSIGTVFVGPEAIRILNSQLADFERRQRGG